MPRGVIDGERWISRRLGFLRELQRKEGLSEAERRAVEDEIEALSKEAGITIAGLRRGRRMRRWFGRW